MIGAIALDHDSLWYSSIGLLEHLQCLQTWCLLALGACAYSQSLASRRYEPPHGWMRSPKRHPDAVRCATGDRMRSHSLGHRHCSLLLHLNIFVQLFAPEVLSAIVRRTSPAWLQAPPAARAPIFEASMNPLDHLVPNEK